MTVATYPFPTTARTTSRSKVMKKGLRLLAQAIVGLINYQSDDGYHIHLDEIYDINTENKTINIELDTDKK